MNTIIRLLAEGEAEHDITQTPSRFWPERYEIIFGAFASLLIFGLLVKFAGPLIKKGMAGRTAKIQAELDAGEAARADAETEAAQIRTAKGDIATERTRILAEADAQAAAILEDGRSRVSAEVADIDIAAAAGRVGDELRAEIASLSSAAVDHVVTGSLDAATHQELIESFITRVGASA
ncbi:MAG: atpF [Acidimicrobiaceae bacterium]|nr:MAG: atpF [Acidimicrobiaceae bacterium]